MSKAQRIRQLNARERIAAQQAAARRAEARRRMYLASGSVLGVIAIVIGLIVWKNANSNSAAAAASARATAAQVSQVSQQITTVPVSTLNAVGKGSNVSALIPTKGQPALTSGGKPEIVYMGAEYCPYCAAERWAMVVALSRFGTFSNLHLIHSSSTDVYPNTPTLSFYKSSYTSQYVDFTPVELFGLKNNGVPLQKPTAAEAALMSKYDVAPYTSVAGQPYPFVDIGNQYLVIGAQYLSSSLAKLTWTQVAADIRNPGSAVAQGVDGAANSITAAICKITNNAPASVCNSASAKAGAGSL
jgi:thiol-disulfide isomerase/thioredoxin